VSRPVIYSLGEPSAFSQNARRYFTKYFGPLNQEVTLAGHRFVLIDAPGLVDEDYRRHGSGKLYEAWKPAAGGPIEFITSIAVKGESRVALALHVSLMSASLESPAPIILFSHIPLSRPASTSCGPLREKGSVRAGAGHGYQNMLGKQTTRFILNTLHPAAVFRYVNINTSHGYSGVHLTLPCVVVTTETIATSPTISQEHIATPPSVK